MFAVGCILRRWGLTRRCGRGEGLLSGRAVYSPGASSSSENVVESPTFSDEEDAPFSKRYSPTSFDEDGPFFGSSQKSSLPQNGDFCGKEEDDSQEDRH